MKKNKKKINDPKELKLLSIFIIIVGIISFLIPTILEKGNFKLVELMIMPLPISAGLLFTGLLLLIISLIGEKRKEKITDIKSFNIVIYVSFISIVIINLKFCISSLSSMKVLELSSVLKKLDSIATISGILFIIAGVLILISLNKKKEDIQQNKDDEISKKEEKEKRSIKNIYNNDKNLFLDMVEIEFFSEEEIKSFEKEKNKKLSAIVEEIKAENK